MVQCNNQMSLVFVIFFFNQLDWCCSSIIWTKPISDQRHLSLRLLLPCPGAVETPVHGDTCGAESAEMLTPGRWCWPLKWKNGTTTVWRWGYKSCPSLCHPDASLLMGGLNEDPTAVTSGYFPYLNSFKLPPFFKNSYSICWLAPMVPGAKLQVV